MKFKRLLLGVGLSVVTIVSTLMVTLAASGSGWAYATIASVNMYGYVDYVNGVFWLKDTLYYNASISGVDAENVAETDKNVYIEPGSDKTTLSKEYLNKGKKYIYNKQVKIKEGSKGVLKLKCYDATKTITGVND